MSAAARSVAPAAAERPPVLFAPRILIGAYGAPPPTQAFAPIPGSETFGVTRRRPDLMQWGGARLIAVSAAAALELTPRDVLLVDMATGFVPVRVARVRPAIAGELDAQYETVVIEARFEDGRCLTFAHDDLLDVEVSA